MQQRTQFINRFVNAYMQAYGSTKTEAERAFRHADEKYISAVIEGFEQNAQKSFWDE